MILMIESAMIKNRRLAAAWRALLALISVSGVVLLFATSGASSRPVLFFYFTTQSNIFIALLYIVLAAGSFRQLADEGTEGTAWNPRPALQLSFVFYITITFIVFALLLDSRFSMEGAAGVSMNLTHYIVPLMALADWILFMPHGMISYGTALAWLWYPAAYALSSFMLAGFDVVRYYDGSRYPYFFLNADRLGWARMAWILLAFTIVFCALGAGMIFLDRLFSRKKPPQSP